MTGDEEAEVGREQEDRIDEEWETEETVQRLRTLLK